MLQLINFPACPCKKTAIKAKKKMTKPIAKTSEPIKLGSPEAQRNSILHKLAIKDSDPYCQNNAGSN
jgi:hypothetical protein